MVRRFGKLFFDGLFDGVVDADNGQGRKLDQLHALRIFILAAIPLTLACGLFFWISKFYLGAVISFIQFCALWIAVTAVKPERSNFLVINFLNLILVSGFVVIAIYSGGITAPILIWLSIPMLIAFWGHGPFLGLYWTLTEMIAVLGLLILAKVDLLPESMVAPKITAMMYFGSVFSFLLFQGFVSLFMLYQRQTAGTTKEELLLSRQTMIQSLAHDLKNPVAGIVSRIYLMERRRTMGNPEDEHFVFEAIKRDASKVLTNIDRMILVNRSKTIQRAPIMIVCELQAVFDDALGYHQQWMNAKGITLEADIKSGQRVIGDRELLVRLFENILSNAVKYSYPQSKIKVSAVTTKWRDRDMLKIEIQDSGVGLDPREAEFFFQLDYRPNRPTAGESSSGAGTRIIKEIMEAHGGKIEVTSEGKNKGCKVQVILTTS